MLGAICKDNPLQVACLAKVGEKVAGIKALELGARGPPACPLLPAFTVLGR